VCVRACVSAKFGHKVTYVSYLHELAKYVPLDQLIIPQRVREWVLPFFTNNNKVIYRELITGPRSRRIVNRHPAINNNLTTKPTPKPNSAYTSN